MFPNSKPSILKACMQAADWIPTMLGKVLMDSVCKMLGVLLTVISSCILVRRTTG
ncbi:hypothetical protein SLEP1_g34112 [Rubroshorea leprosula]|uniref:Uncharacterized protein n=1 Tax=Rubroshorea leprosula TaxID=152421 RepID=A0AAV5KIT2_9ROSI|nr:hypothetical protein SLEP1_g34112 [Rubroshorea leprosula]